MKKIRLNLDALAVDTFDTAAAKEGKGTVLANSATHPYLSNCANTCDDCPSVYSCNVPFNCA
jgi:hypothetical protein